MPKKKPRDKVLPRRRAQLTLLVQVRKTATSPTWTLARIASEITSNLQYRGIRCTCSHFVVHMVRGNGQWND